VGAEVSQARGTGEEALSCKVPANLGGLPLDLQAVQAYRHRYA
jgi:hypothetical protein